MSVSNAGFCFCLVMALNLLTAGIGSARRDVGLGPVTQIAERGENGVRAKIKTTPGMGTEE